MHNEQIFTPDWVVNMMLNKIGYIPSADIHDKHIIDNSCGDGAFLCEIVDRFIKKGVVDGISSTDLKHLMETHIHGIEVDNNLCAKTIGKLNKVASKYSITNVKWDIVNKDAIDCKEYWYKMDYVVGNPPYCRIQDVPEDKREKYKAFCFFAEEDNKKPKGAFDSYMLFFNIGIRMLSRIGKLSYITPSSWTTNLYGNSFREYLTDKKALEYIIDMGHAKVFDKATTFTMITGISNFHRNKTTPVFRYNEEKKTLDLINNVNINDYLIDKKFYFKNNDTLNTLRHINDADTSIEKVFTVKNGFATLKDKLFIGEISEMRGILHDDNIIFCTKASKNVLKSIIFPYDKDGKPLKFEELSKEIQNKLLSRAKVLNVDTNKENWYLYGRSQAINDVNKNKYAINNLIKTREDIKLHYCCSETGIYSGFYILSKDDFRSSEVRQFVEETINSNEFVNYIHSLGRYKNGGFSTFTTKELEKYLNFKWKERKNIFLTNFYDEKFGCIKNK